MSDLTVGEQWRLSFPEISRTTLALFAGASGDHNPIHIDIDVARAAGMDDVFAHGMLSMAYLGRLVTERVPQGRIRSLTARFLAITPVGAQPTAIGRVEQIVDTPDGGQQARLALGIVLADGTATIAGDALVDVA